jgi:hypothetical protein
MLRRACLALAVVVCLVVPVVVQAQGGDYLDVYTVKVRPEKLADFQAIAKKMADANRKNNGDHWLATETVYGEGDTYTFISTRQDYADIDKGGDAFYGALAKAYGKDGSQKILNDWEACLAGSRSEFRRRRWDLSWKVPDAASYAKFIADSRVLHTTRVHVRPGHLTDFEGLLKEAKAAAEKAPNTQGVFVSQVIEGNKGTTFYVTSLRSSIGGFDKNPTIHDILGDEGYKKFLQVNAEAVENTESMLLRFSPELSNPPQEVIAAAPDFWQPKPVVATHTAKPKAAPVKPAAERTKEQ